MNPNGLACYPKSFKSTLVSEEKICFQFSNPQVKLRQWDEEGCVVLPNTVPALPIPITGIDLSVVAVGCNLETIIELQVALNEACREHAQRFDNSPFKDSAYV